MDQNTPQKTVTIADVVAYLLTLPQEAEVWRTWDESGEAWPVTEYSSLPQYVAPYDPKTSRLTNDGKPRWMDEGPVSDHVSFRWPVPAGAKTVYML